MQVKGFGLPQMGPQLRRYNRDHLPMEIRRLTELDAEWRSEIVWSPPMTTLSLGLLSIGSSSGWPDSFVAGEKRSATGAGFGGVHVSQECRGKGVGQALLAELIGLVQLLPGIEQVALAVSRENAGAKALYESLGFEVYVAKGAL